MYELLPAPTLRPLPAAYAHGRVRVALLDTDYLLNRVEADVRGRIYNAYLSGRYQLEYAAEHVAVELYRDDGHGHPTKWHKLSEQAAERGEDIPPSNFREVFERDYLPKIRFVEMGALFWGHPLAQAVRAIRNGRGASDGPTAQLAVLLSRLLPVAYSHDEHLYKPGVAPRPRVFPEVRRAEDDLAVTEYLFEGGTAATLGSIAGLDYLARRAGAALGAATWLSRLALLGVGWYVLRDPARREAVGRVAMPMLEKFGEALERAATNQQRLLEAAVAVDPDDGLPARIAEVLVRRADEGPLLAKDIQDGLIEHGLPRDQLPTIAELRASLAEAPCFEERSRWRFTLGHRYAPVGRQ